MSEGKCEYPQCPPEGIISDIKKDMSDLCKDVKEILQAVNEQKVVNVGLNDLVREVRELKTTHKSDLDETFNRLRQLEIKGVCKEDIKGMVTKGDMIGIITIIGVLFAVVSFIVNLGARLIK